MKYYVLLAGFIALGVVLGYTFIAVPNVELVTLTVFLCGSIMGIRSGILCGAVTETIYGILNPQGMAAPPLLISMILSMALTGCAGGLMKHLRPLKGLQLHIITGIAGFLCTLLFAILTTLGYALGVGIHFDQLWFSLIAGLPFYLTHIFVNTALFISAAPLLIRWFRKLRFLPVMTGFILIILPSGLLEGQDYVHEIRIDQTPQMNYRHLGDIIQYLPGIQYRNLSFGGNWAGFRISGTPLHYSNIFLNGFSIKDPVTGMADLRLIPVEMVSHLGIHSLSVYSGQNTIGGSLFLRSQSLMGISKPYTKAVYRTGPDKWSDLDITFGQKYAENFKLIGGVLLHHEGEGTSYEHHRQQVRSNIQWQPIDALQISYTILHNIFKSDLQYPVTAPLDTNFILNPNLRRDQADHMFRSTFYTGQHPIQFSWHYTAAKYRLTDRYSSKKDTIRGLQHQWTLEQQIPFTKKYCGWRIHIENQALNVDTLNVRHANWEALLFFQHASLYNSTMKSQIGVHKGTESLFFGKTLLIFNWDTTMTVWSGLHRSYREPTLAEKTGAVFLPTAPEYNDHWTILHFSDRFTSNQSIHPESAWTLDAGIHVKLSGFKTSIRGYYQKTGQLLKLNPLDNLLQFKNLGTQTYYGCETQSQLNLGSHLKLLLILNLARATEQGKILLERPDLWGSTALSWRHLFFDKELDCRFVIQAQFWSEYYSLYGYDMETVQAIYHQPNWLLNGKLMLRIIQNAVISFSLDNILDTSAACTDGLLLPARSFRIGYFWELFD